MTKALCNKIINIVIAESETTESLEAALKIALSVDWTRSRASKQEFDAIEKILKDNKNSREIMLKVARAMLDENYN